MSRGNDGRQAIAGSGQDLEDVRGRRRGLSITPNVWPPAVFVGLPPAALRPFVKAWT
jgi:hypothetical protein